MAIQDYKRLNSSQICPSFLQTLSFRSLPSSTILPKTQLLSPPKQQSPTSLDTNMPFTPPSKQATETPGIPAEIMPWLDTMPQYAASSQAKEGVQEGGQSQFNDQAQDPRHLSALIGKFELSVVLHFTSPSPYYTTRASSFCIHI